MDLGIREKCMLVVGASAGVGAACAKLLAAEGAKLVLVARRSPDLDAFAATLRAAGSEVLAIAGNAAEPGLIEEVVHRAVDRFGALHGVAVLAGPMGPRARLDELDDADWEYYFRNSLMLAVGVCRTAIPELLKTSGGAVVLTSAYSIRAQKPDLVAYTAFKTAIASVTKNLAKTYGPRGLRVNCIAPGVIEKSAANRREMAERYGVTEERARYEFVHREYGMNVALERAGRHEEFADLVGYLLSERASYITGATVNIDGGTDF